MELSFVGIHRESSVKPRSFTPNYGSHFSLSLPTVMSTSHSGPPSLAENISKGSLLLSVFHKVEGSTSKGSDILLCKVGIFQIIITENTTIDLLTPLLKRTLYKSLKKLINFVAFNLRIAIIIYKYIFSVLREKLLFLNLYNCVGEVQQPITTITTCTNFG